MLGQVGGVAMACQALCFQPAALLPCCPIADQFFQLARGAAWPLTDGWVTFEREVKRRERKGGNQAAMWKGKLLSPPDSRVKRPLTAGRGPGSAGRESSWVAFTPSPIDCIVRSPPSPSHGEWL